MIKLTRLCYPLSLLSVCFFLFQSCSEDAATDTGDIELTQTEVQTILETDEIASVADNALAELFAGNTVTNKSANDCYSATYSDTGFEATFNNCVLNGTDNVNGTLTVTYAVGNESAASTATYVDFYVGTIKINGTRTYNISGDVQQNGIFFTVTSEMSVEFEDGSTISENGTKTFGFTFGEDLASSTYSLSGNWQVQANGNTYQIETNGDLVGNLSCEYLVSGSMDVSKNGLEITVDFGDGECDDIATLTYPNGAMEEISL